MPASTALRAWRKRLGITQAEAAAGLGMTTGGYGDLERGTTCPDGPTTLHRLAAAAVEAGLPPIADEGFSPAVDEHGDPVMFVTAAGRLAYGFISDGDDA